jgi:hypothetical protein
MAEAQPESVEIQTAEQVIEAPVTEVSEAPVPEAVVKETPVEKLVTQEEMNRVVKAAKWHTQQETANRVRQEYEQKLQQLQQASAPQQAQMPSAQQVPQQVDEATVVRVLQDMAQKQYVNGIVETFTSKIAAVDLNEYPDFVEEYGKINLQSVPNVVGFASGLDNTAEVMYELAKNPLKMQDLERLAREQPMLAPAEFAKLSASIKQNKSAAKQKLPPQPLAKITPSARDIDSGNVHSMSVDDLRKMPWCR